MNTFSKNQIYLWQNRRLSSYAGIGLFALLVEMSLFSVGVLVLPVLVANFMAVLSGMLISFSLNARFNFGVNDRLVRRFYLYAVVIACGYLLGSSVILGLMSLGLPAVAAKLVSLPLVFAFQYNLNKNLAFKAND